ncbi:MULTISPECIES: universal stress protein [Chelativorans]|jgi:nucleotide-binding universal stress UspA family protein|uniref:UspA n=1 Tax=Chelativorans sp. (strain BNC1) TaxID=266779 RepID=Q11K94_CHESB|nr:MULTISPECIES: universal stress protein [Chelativorans]
MPKILALVDGSIYAESVAGISAWAAQRLGLPVEAAHVLGRRVLSSFDLSGNLEADERGVLLQELADLDAQHGKIAQQKGRAILDAAKTLLQSAGVADVSTKLRNGDLLEMLADLEADAEMIVIGKRGEAADFAKLHLGSNVERVVRAAKKPVLVAARGYAPFDRFLIAYDGGRSANRAVEYVASSPLLKGMKCTILTVGADTPENRSRLEAPKLQLEQAGFTVSAVLESGEPDEVIGRRVETDGIGLLVMGAYGHSRIRSLVIGSTTTAMVRRCKIPVLMFRE